jgi:UDP-N-acetylmuramoyl-L-alanyl-D-glutamate--2,6-diaminopimelate ligase
VKPLSELLRDVRTELIRGDADAPVQSISTDSRSAEPGDAFVCLPGYRTEGGETRADRHAFAADAAARGATVFVVERDIETPPGTTVVRVPDCWTAVSRMACELYGHPSRNLKVVGVTGTSGKTSTTYFIESVLRAAGTPAACLGTIEYRFGDEVLPAIQTTPEAPQLQALLRKAIDRGMSAAVMEVSSHALELRRVGGVAFDVAVFTNISQDHLNFHADMHHYLRAKGRLFQELGSGGKKATAVVNIDDSGSSHILEVNGGALLTYGRSEAADLRAVDIESDLGGTRFTARIAGASHAVELPHLGDYQVYNALAAFGAGVALGLDPSHILSGLASAPPIPGRFELVDCGQSFRVAVDYAHKPDALERLLRSGRSLHPHRLITVVGCGGDRDRQKRPLMGRIAAELSDVAIITSDNPRSEDPLAIIDGIVAGARQVPGAGDRLRIEPDRARAIAMAVALAQPDDLILIAGKGHETYQILGDRRIHFDDREQVRMALTKTTG